MTVRQAARALSVGTERIRQLCKYGILECSKPGGRDWDVDEESVDRELERRRGKDEGKTTEEI